MSTAGYVLAALAAVSLIVILSIYRHRRVRRYRELAQHREALVVSHAPQFTLPPAEQAADVFQRDFVSRVTNVLHPESLQRLREECLASQHLLERSFIPLHKKGGTLCYERVHLHNPACLAVYHSLGFREWLSAVIGEDVVPTADHDQSSCSVLYYTEAGDHIGWHYDHNFYKGRHFTVLISIVNQNPAGGISSSKLQRQTVTGDEIGYDTSENSLIVFEGSRVLHRATPTEQGDLRVILSMTFATDPRTGRVKELARRVKDTAFYGLRALWD